MNRLQTKFLDKRGFSYRNRRIGIIIPTTSKGFDNISDLPFFKILLPSFLKCCSNLNYYHFFIGYDHDDLLMEKRRKEIRDKFSEMCTDRYSITFVKFDETVEKGDLSTMWSVLAERATAEYLFQLGDDIEFKTYGWEEIFMRVLDSKNNIGVIGPKDEGNNTGIITQSFVHATHLSIFERYFPKELKNWHIDDWISEVYQGSFDKRVVVLNRGRVRYQVEDLKDVKDGLVERDQKIVTELLQYKKRNIIRIKSRKNFIYTDGGFLVIVNKSFSEYDMEFDGELNSRLIKKCIGHMKKPEISFYIEGKLCHRNGNYVLSNEDMTTIVQNIENIRLQRCDDDIYLFQQFFIPSDEERRLEVNECLRRNVSLGLFKKIYLLNERIYSPLEMGLKKEELRNVVQINIGKRLTYKKFLNHASRMKGFAVLSNSDIFFDETIDNVRTSVMRDVKSIQCLRRYEYRGEEDLNECRIYGNFESSQDSWIIHTSQIMQVNDECDISLGIPGCDNKITEIFRCKGYMLLNSYPLLRNYHNHRSQKRNYTQSQIPRPFSFALRSTPLPPTEEIMERHHLFWQYPVITEKTFYEQNKNDPKYVGLPWATIIDKRKKLDMEFLIKNLYMKKSYTCCQHIHFREIIPLLEKLGIRTLYTPHKVIGEDSIDGVTLKPCPLYAKVFEDSPSLFSKKEERTLLYSFQGGYQKGYLTDIRERIFRMKHPENAFVRCTGGWHFNQIVYNEKQNKNGEYNGSDSHFENEQKYIELLKTSRYTLCPSGTGPNSIRFWEALGAGSIPILLSDSMELPKHELWPMTILRIPEKDLETIPTVLGKITSEEEEIMRTNCLTVYNFFCNNYKGA